MRRAVPLVVSLLLVAAACTTAGGTETTVDAHTAIPSEYWSPVDLSGLGDLSSITAIAGHRGGVVVTGVRSDGEFFYAYSADLVDWVDLESDTWATHVGSFATIAVRQGSSSREIPALIGLGYHLDSPVWVEPGALSMPGLLPVDWEWDQLPFPLSADHVYATGAVDLGDGWILAVGFADLAEGTDSQYTTLTWSFSPVTGKWLYQGEDSIEARFQALVNDGEEIIAIGSGYGDSRHKKIWVYDTGWVAQPTPDVLDKSGTIEFVEAAIALGSNAPADLLIAGFTSELGERLYEPQLWMRNSGQWSAIPPQYAPASPSSQVSLQLTGVAEYDGRLVIIGDQGPIGQLLPRPVMWVLDPTIGAYLAVAG